MYADSPSAVPVINFIGNTVTEGSIVNVSLSQVSCVNY